MALTRVRQPSFDDDKKTLKTDVIARHLQSSFKAIQKRIKPQRSIHWQAYYLDQLIQAEWLVISLMLAWSGFLFISALC